ncbi:hypothetical protein ZTR_07698 [Talaromyces verruculosus]|nr:hypothetical protein ZTR_07698 [Talaromyces verruculosus]
MSPRSSTEGQPNNPNASLKPWSTGRVLSPAQRERKRLMNRASQSRRRKNLKNTLKTVEARLFQIERRCLAYLPPSTSGEYTFNDCIAATANASADESTTLRDLLNDLLGSIYHINPAQVCANEQFNQDAVIRGVILGWDDVVQKQAFVCPIWNILRRVDALLMMHASVPTRLALLRGIHMMLLGRRLSDKPPPLPQWFKPRKYHSYSSENIVNDYFAW